MLGLRTGGASFGFCDQLLLSLPVLALLLVGRSPYKPLSIVAFALEGCYAKGNCVVLCYDTSRDYIKASCMFFSLFGLKVEQTCIELVSILCS